MMGTSEGRHTGLSERNDRHFIHHNQEEILDRINQVIVKAGHRALKKKPEDGIVGRCDSFVVETDVHFLTDNNLLLDAMRKIIGLCSELSVAETLSGWRQHFYHQRQFKKQYRQVQQLKHSTSKNEDKGLPANNMDKIALRFELDLVAAIE